MSDLPRHLPESSSILEGMCVGMYKIECEHV